jgi:hypothetical protein
LTVADDAGDNQAWSVRSIVARAKSPSQNGNDGRVSRDSDDEDPMEIDRPRAPSFQFSLSRLLWLTAIVAVILTAFSQLPLGAAAMLLCLANVAAARIWSVLGSRRLALMAYITTFLILFAWSSIAWGLLIPFSTVRAVGAFAAAAIASQLATLGYWLISAD